QVQANCPGPAVRAPGCSPFSMAGYENARPRASIPASSGLAELRPCRANGPAQHPAASRGHVADVQIHLRERDRNVERTERLHDLAVQIARSEERRVGKECRARWSAEQDTRGDA